MSAARVAVEKKPNVYEPAAVVLTAQTLAVFPQGWCMRTGICSLYLLDGSVLLAVVCSLPVVSLQGRPEQICASSSVFLIYCRGFVNLPLSLTLTENTSGRDQQACFDCHTRGSPVGSISVLGLLQLASN